MMHVPLPPPTVRLRVLTCPWSDLQFGNSSPRDVMSERQKGDEGVKGVKHQAAHLRLTHVQFRRWDQPGGGTCHEEKVGVGGVWVPVQSTSKECFSPIGTSGLICNDDVVGFQSTKVVVALEFDVCVASLLTEW